MNRDHVSVCHVCTSIAYYVHKANYHHKSKTSQKIHSVKNKLKYVIIYVEVNTLHCILADVHLFDVELLSYSVRRNVQYNFS